MAKEGIGRLISIGPAKTRYVSVPAEVASDDRFPIKVGDRLWVTIEGDSIIIRSLVE